LLDLETQILENLHSSIEDEGILNIFAEVFATLIDEMSWQKGIH
jgi:hypothetical protein